MDAVRIGTGETSACMSGQQISRREIVDAVETAKTGSGEEHAALWMEKDLQPAYG